MDLAALENVNIPAFESVIPNAAYLRTRPRISIMQANIGRLCNLACKHCHVEAGPQRTDEIMKKPVMEACLKVLRENEFRTLDITGGAPEMNPYFRWFAAAAREICDQVIVRTNLVILLEPGYEDLPRFYKERELEVVCSLPHYTEKSTDKMRGSEVFARSLKALKILNRLGYGLEDNLKLNIVYNPGGAFLPPDQEALEEEFRHNFRRNYDVEFNRLLTITNNPVGRFGAFLTRSGNLEGYMSKLYAAFNVATLEGMMCRDQISVACDGRLYDCDFNQAADRPIASRETIFDWLHKSVATRPICFGQHCYACTAGQGSSCAGATEGLAG